MTVDNSDCQYQWCEDEGSARGENIILIAILNLAGSNGNLLVFACRNSEKASKV